MAKQSAAVAMIDWDLLESVEEDLFEICPCRNPNHKGILRWLQDEDFEDEEDTILWEILYVCGVLFFMFYALVTDLIGADSVMLTALTAFMAAGIIDIEEALKGFSNEGLLTVLALFVVADGISKTGALDWYMGKLLGRPETTASAQLRLMAPIAIVSAFLNNTPVVAVMIPIVQRWSRNIHISAQQLLIPLSFASILGGTCTLIGTSTNLVVVGLLQERYPGNPNVEIGLFDLGQYGVPVAFAGVCYILLASPFLLPGGKGGKKDRGSIDLDNQEDVLLGARLTPWSPAAGRSVKRSGLRDTGGIYLVSVHRAATGNVHRAVGQEFVLNVGDVLYFTGLVEGFGEFCEEHGMEVLTNESQTQLPSNTASTTTQTNLKAGDKTKSNETSKGASSNQVPSNIVEEKGLYQDTPLGFHGSSPSLLTAGKSNLMTVVEGQADDEEVPIVEVGVTKESLLQADEAERSRAIARMIDLIRGLARDEPVGGDVFADPSIKVQAGTLRPHKVVVTSDNEFVVAGIDARDRPGLMLDISKGLSRLNLNLRHTEASVVGARSISIWRCELVNADLPDLEEIWSVLNALLESETGSQAVKQRGLRVIRAVVTKTSSLIGTPASDVDFRKQYRAAIVAIQKGGRNVTVSTVVFGSGDVLVLQVSEDSPLLKIPPADFYKRQTDSKDAGTMSRTGSVASFVNMLTKTVAGGFTSPPDIQLNSSRRPTVLSDEEPQRREEEEPQKKEEQKDDDGDFFFGSGDSSEDENESRVENEAAIAGMVTSMQELVADERAWTDLQVVVTGAEKSKEDGAGTREFLSAMEVAPKSKLANRTVAEIGLDKLPGVFLVSIDRPTVARKAEEGKRKVSVITKAADLSQGSGHDESVATSLPTVDPIFTTIPPDSPLKEGDVLWFAGSASAVGDLRKVPGLLSYESEEVEKINEKVHDRRLVEAVIARRGPLVGKTVKEVRFRTRYGAAVISVHREGKRVHDHPGKIKLQAGDVLLLEGGPTFMKKNTVNDRSFALLAEVEDSAPPRLTLLIPALVITVAMLAVFTAGVASLLVCALVASILMIALGILSEQEARDAVNWEVYLTIASAFGIGTALVNSGVAGGIANFLVSVGESVGIGDAGLLGAVYFATFLISNVVTNNAAAALLFPIAMDAAEQTKVDIRVMSYCLMLGASASFMTPFGYTTNLLIYGPGGYKYTDFLVIGTPMQLVLWVLSIMFLATTTSSNWWISWLATGLALVAVVSTRIFDPWSSCSRNRSLKTSYTTQATIDDKITQV